MRRMLGWWMSFLLGAVPGAAMAQAEPPVPLDGDGEVVDMAPVLVAGVQPGPGLWRVSKDDHVLYILGTQSPLPRDIDWDAREVREVLDEAGAVLGSPGLSVDADVGFFRGLTLVPSAMKAMRNPGGATLDKVLPPELYARWLPLKQQYVKP